MDYDKKILESSEIGINTLLNVMKEKEDLSEYDDYKLGAILKGRLEAMNTVRKMTDSNDFSKTFIKATIESLKQSSENMFLELAEILSREIDSDSTKLENIAKTKGLALDTMVGMKDIIKDLEIKIKTGASKLGKTKIKSYAERFAKNTRNG